MAAVSWPGPRARKRRSQEAQALPADCPQASTLQPGLAGCQVARPHLAGDPGNPDALGEGLAGPPWEMPLEVEGVWLASSCPSPPVWGVGCSETCPSTGPFPSPGFTGFLPYSVAPPAPGPLLGQPPRPATCSARPLMVQPSAAASSGRRALEFAPRAGALFPMLASSMMGAAASHRCRVPSRARRRFAERRSDCRARVRRSGVGGVRCGRRGAQPGPAL